MDLAGSRGNRESRPGPRPGRVLHPISCLMTEGALDSRCDENDGEAGRVRRMGGRLRLGLQNRDHDCDHYAGNDGSPNASIDQ